VKHGHLPRTLGLVLLAALGLDGRAWATSETDRFDLCALSLGTPPGEEQLSALDRVAWELEKRTSLHAAAHAPVLQAADPHLRRHPLLVLHGPRSLPPLDERSLDALRGHLEAGGLLFIDSANADLPLNDDPFDRDVHELVRRLFPRGVLDRIGRDHVLYKSYYLLDAPLGRRARSPTLEGVVLDGRLAIIYSRNDVLGALARDRLGAFAHSVDPGGEVQREQALRLMINVVMYALCLDYKADQVHAPELLKRRRGRP
jgi:hypothetical protein